MSTKASIIICTYNRAEKLPGLFDAFRSQTFPSDQYEIIIINDGSTDNSDLLIRQFQKLLPNLIYIRNETNLGLAASANQGISSSCSETLLFTDDDCIPDPEWVEKMIAAVSTSPIVCGQILTKPKPYLSLARNIAEYHPVILRERPGPHKIIAGANMGFLRGVFTKIGVFKEGCVTPDMELLLRALNDGYTVNYEPHCKITHNPINKTILQTCKYEASRSFCTIQLRAKYKELLKTPAMLQSAFLLIMLSPFLAFFKTLQIFLTNPRMLIFFHTFPVVFLLKIAWCLGAAKGLRNYKSLSAKD